MKLSLPALSGVFAVALLASASPLPPRSSPPARPEEEGQRVIVIMRDQLPNLGSPRGSHAVRASALRASQEPVLSGLQRQRSRSARSFELVNAFSTTVSASERAQLAAHPAVAAVVDDAIIHPPAHAGPLGGAKVHGTTIPPYGADAPVCDTLEPEALQLTNTAFIDPTVPQAQGLLDGNGAPVNGKGVKVAFIADGLDTTIPGFTRPDGSPVFIDYQDFSGDPAGTPTEGAEAYGDASSIAAQDLPFGQPLLFDISSFGFPFPPLPAPCNIRVRGVAPGASLVGLKIFSSLGYSSFVSTAVAAIEYAAVHDDVDVINESFGQNPFPDLSTDPISLANAAAVRSGVTVVVSSGDAGTAGTLGSPSTDPSVISTGASTQFRSYAQTGSGLFPLTGGWLSNNISALSSGGFASKRARTVDVVAPGDLGWALCSTNGTLYTGCVDFSIFPAAAQPVQDFGGTSESAPLTSGEAALVIQAYRSTHRGASPAPALVKQIIMSSATDLGAPADEQGAGLINTLKAVQLALSLDARGRNQPSGNGLLNTPASYSSTAPAGAPQLFFFEVSNTGATTQKLRPSLQTLGPPFAGASSTLQMDATTNSVIEQSFTVPAGAEHLDAAIGFQTTYGAAYPYVFFGLADPEGRQAAFSLPQGGDNGYGHVDVVHPEAGVWTLVAYTYYNDPVYSYVGPLAFTWSAEKYVDLGEVFPSQLVLPPGSTGYFAAAFAMPSQPGDVAAGIRFAGAANQSEIPVTLRSLIPIAKSGGTFSGVLTGGNGRGGTGPTQTFDFDVPEGIGDMSLALTVADPGYIVEGLLIDPNGMPLSVEGNIDANGNLGGALELFRDHPQAGRWRFILLLNYYASGNETSTGYSARISFNKARFSAQTALPNSARARLSASGAPLTVQLLVTQHRHRDAELLRRRAPQWPRLAAIPVLPCNGVTVTLPGFCGSFYLPTQVRSLAVSAQSPAPITMDVSNDQGFIEGYTGSPGSVRVPRRPPHGGRRDRGARGALWKLGRDPLADRSLRPGWRADDAGGGLRAGDDAGVRRGGERGFGDMWADLTFGTNTFNPLTLNPGQSGVINVSIAPDASQVGKTISGSIYLDTFNFEVFTGDEVAQLPYSYTVSK